MREYALESVGITEGPLWDWWKLMLFSQGGESHSRLRRLVSKAFTPRKVELMRPAIRDIARGLIDDLDGRESCEFVSDFAAPFAVSVIGHLLGIDKSDHDQFYAASSDLALAFTGQIAQEQPRIERGLAVLQAYADELIARRRKQPVGDLVSDLIAAEEQGDRLSEAEVQMLITILIFGGLDTTQCQFACANRDVRPPPRPVAPARRKDGTRVTRDRGDPPLRAGRGRSASSRRDAVRLPRAALR
jgi:cytochrome P450